jgi:hypothetical protein
MVIADDQAEPVLVVREENVGWVVPGDLDRLLAVIDEACQNPTETCAKGRRAPVVVVSKYSYNQAMGTSQCCGISAE